MKCEFLDVLLRNISKVLLIINLEFNFQSFANWPSEAYIHLFETQ